LIEWITTNKATRQENWLTIPSIFGWDCGIDAIHNALKREGYVRRVARQKPPLSDEQRAIRLQWAQEHINWTWEQWSRILWTDESWMRPGRHKKIWITRKKGPSEVYHPDCVEPCVRRRIGWMYWGCISGLYGKGVGLFWKKSWGSINSKSYCERVVPLIAEYFQQHPGLQFQQDNASGHASQYTKEHFALHGIQPIFWPANSPDLNPIEDLWDWMKDWIQDHDSQVHRNYKRLQTAVNAAWEAIPYEKIFDLIKGMKDRCQAVIDANGGETKY